LLKQIEKVIATLRCTEKESVALVIAESGANDLRPSLVAHGGELIEYDEIETVAAERVGAIGSTDGDGGAVVEMDAEIGFGGTVTPMHASVVFETIPEDAFGLRITGADVPDETTPYGGSAQHLGERELRFAEAPARRDDTEAGRIVKNEQLLFAEGE